MTDTNGIDVLIAWSTFTVFTVAFLVLLLRPGVKDPVAEAHRETEAARRDHARREVRELPAETAGGRVDAATDGPNSLRYPPDQR